MVKPKKSKGVAAAASLPKLITTPTPIPEDKLIVLNSSDLSGGYDSSSESTETGDKLDRDAKPWNRLNQKKCRHGNRKNGSTGLMTHSETCAGLINILPEEEREKLYEKRRKHFDAYVNELKHKGQHGLCTEIGRCLKKVCEGVEEFDVLWEEATSPANANMKEKYDADLKKEVKKLQKFRDQIKVWLGEVNDPSTLYDARKLIETQMERQRLFEKESRVKTFSTSGLNNTIGHLHPEDPMTKLKNSLRNWLNDTMENFRIQLDQLEINLAAFMAEIKKKSIDLDKQIRADKLKSQVSTHCTHIGKLETILRTLDNIPITDTTTLQSFIGQVKAIQDDIEYYLECGLEDDFVINEYLYDDIEALNIYNEVAVTLSTSLLTESTKEDEENLSSKNSEHQDISVTPSPSEVKKVSAAPKASSLETKESSAVKPEPVVSAWTVPPKFAVTVQNDEETSKAPSSANKEIGDSKTPDLKSSAIGSELLKPHIKNKEPMKKKAGLTTSAWKIPPNLLITAQKDNEELKIPSSFSGKEETAVPKITKDPKLSSTGNKADRLQAEIKTTLLKHKEPIITNFGLATSAWKVPPTRLLNPQKKEEKLKIPSSPTKETPSPKTSKRPTKNEAEDHINFKNDALDLEFPPLGNVIEKQVELPDSTGAAGILSTKMSNGQARSGWPASLELRTAKNSRQIVSESSSHLSICNDEPNQTRQEQLKVHPDERVLNSCFNTSEEPKISISENEAKPTEHTNNKEALPEEPQDHKRRSTDSNQIVLAEHFLSTPLTTVQEIKEISQPFKFLVKSPANTKSFEIPDIVITPCEPLDTKTVSLDSSSEAPTATEAISIEYTESVCNISETSLPSKHEDEDIELENIVNSVSGPEISDYSDVTETFSQSLESGYHEEQNIGAAEYEMFQDGLDNNSESSDTAFSSGIPNMPEPVHNMPSQEYIFWSQIFGADLAYIKSQTSSTYQPAWNLLTIASLYLPLYDYQKFNHKINLHFHGMDMLHLADIYTQELQFILEVKLALARRMQHLKTHTLSVNLKSNELRNNLIQAQYFLTEITEMWTQVLTNSFPNGNIPFDNKTRAQIESLIPAWRKDEEALTELTKSWNEVITATNHCEQVIKQFWNWAIWKENIVKSKLRIFDIEFRRFEDYLESLYYSVAYPAPGAQL